MMIYGKIGSFWKVPGKSCNFSIKNSLLWLAHQFFEISLEALGILEEHERQLASIKK